MTDEQPKPIRLFLWRISQSKDANLIGQTAYAPSKADARKMLRERNGLPMMPFGTKLVRADRKEREK